MSVPPPLMRVPEGLPSELKLVTPLGSAAPIIVADVGSEANAGPEELSSPGSQEEPSQTSAPRLEEGGSSEADPETPLTQPARPIAESTTNSAERAERNLGLSVSGRTVAVRSGPAMMAESADELPSGAPPEVRDPVPAGNSQDPAELAAALSQAQSPLETATSPQTVRLGRSTPTPARPPRGAPLPEAPPPELMINSLGHPPH